MYYVLTLSPSRPIIRIFWPDSRSGLLVNSSLNAIGCKKVSTDEILKLDILYSRYSVDRNFIGNYSDFILFQISCSLWFSCILMWYDKCILPNNVKGLLNWGQFFCKILQIFFGQFHTLSIEYCDKDFV